MSEDRVIYGKEKKERKTELMMVRLSPSYRKLFAERAVIEKRRPAELARVIIERYVDR